MNNKMDNTYKILHRNINEYTLYIKQLSEEK